MIKLIIRFALPLTIVSFGVFSKWWYGIAFDAKDVYMNGFPLIHKSEGFHTSMSTQYFMIEMLVNLLVYFSCCLLVMMVINRFWKIAIPAKVSKLFWVGFSIYFITFLYLSKELDNRFLLKRPFEVKVLDSGFTIFQSNSKDREKYQLD